MKQIGESESLFPTFWNNRESEKTDHDVEIIMKNGSRIVFTKSENTEKYVGVSLPDLYDLNVPEDVFEIGDDIEGATKDDNLPSAVYRYPRPK